MNRRSFLRGLLALPLAPLATKLLPKPPSLLDYAKAHPVPAVVESTPWASGSDQTSIWQVEWFDLSGYILPDGPIPVRPLFKEI